MASSVLFVLLSVAVANDWTTRFDEVVLVWINQFASPALDEFFLFVTSLGGVVFVALASIILLAVAAYRKRFIKMWVVAVGMGGMILANLLLKAAFERPRPDLWQWIVTETSYSFPSGHATASMALALCILSVLWWSKWRLAAIVVAGLYVLMVGLSRMYLGVHFPTDIFGGWLLALAWVSLVYVGVYGYVAKSRKNKEIAP